MIRLIRKTGTEDRRARKKYYKKEIRKRKKKKQLNTNRQTDFQTSCALKIVQWYLSKYIFVARKQTV